MINLNPETQLGTLIENQFGDLYLFSVNRKNFETIDYQTLFNKEFGKTFEQQDSLYIISGTDSGLLVKQLLKTPPKKGSTYLFIEFPEIIELTKSQYSELEEENEDYRRIVVTTEDKWEEEAKKLGLETYCYINKVKQVKSLASQYYHIGEYLFLRKAIEDRVNHLIWNYQTQIGNQIFEQRQLENLAENHSPAIHLKDYFKGKSALILAGGPSLDNYIKWIEENQEHYVVIAVTRIARRLLQTKIKPDIFISVDPHPANFSVSKEVFNYEKESLLINQFHVSPMLLGNWLGINFYLDELFPWKTKLNVENLTGIGPTVTNTAVMCAINLGIKQQILFGVDLCYSPEGYTHANASREHDNGPMINEIGLTVTTNKGEKSETNAAYFEGITAMEYLAKLALQSGGTLINPSPDSTKIKNVEHFLINDIKISTEQVSIKEFLQQQFKKQENSDFKVKHYKAVLKELKTAQFKIDKIEELANKGLEYNEKFFADGDPSANFKYKLKMDNVEKELNRKKLESFTNLSKKFGVREFLYFLNPDSDREWTDDDIKQSGDIYYKALRTGAVELGKQIFTAINRTEIRLLENNELTVNEETIKKHFCSFGKTLLVENLLNSILSKRINKSKEIRIFKQRFINDIKKITESYYNGIISLSFDEKHQSISFMLFAIQTSIDRQMKRLYILEKENPKLFNSMGYLSLLDKSTNGVANLGGTINEIKERYKKTCKQWSLAKVNTSESNKSKLEGLEIKLYNLFTKKDKIGLKKIINGMQLIKNKETEHKALLHLTKGYLNELNNNPDIAIEEYGFSVSPKTTESALKRIAFITLNNNQLEYAHKTLQILSELSPSYLPQVAELYLLTKNYSNALETYTKYLEYNSSEITILLKVGKLYEDQEIIDGAIFIYKHILEIDPNNQVALSSLDKLKVK